MFNSADDPIKLGLVASLNHPGGNLTGSSRLSIELMPKRLELLHEVISGADSVAVLVNAKQIDAESRAKRAAESARLFHWQAEVIQAGTDHDIEAAFASLAQLRVGSLLIN